MLACIWLLQYAWLISIGEVLRGDRIVNTPYDVRENINFAKAYRHVNYSDHDRHFFSLVQLRVKKDEPCRVLCSVDLDTKTTNIFIDRIKDDYTVHM